MFLGPEMRGLVATLQANIVRLIRLATRVTRAQKQLLPLCDSVFPQRAGPLSVVHDGEQIRRQIGVTASGGRGGSTLWAIVARRARVIRNERTRHF